MVDEHVEAARPGDTTTPVEQVDPASSTGSAGTAGAVRKGAHRRKKATKPRRPFWVEAVALLVIAMGIALVVHTFFFQAFFIPSGSMENTLHIGDRVLVNKLSYRFGDVQRGQIVVFNGEDSWTPETRIAPPSNVFERAARDVGSFLGFAPAGEKDFIKRVIGIPGDHVTCCDAQGRIHINGTPLNESYLYTGLDDAPGGVVPTTTVVNKPKPFDIVVPPGRLWVEGDHRSDSADSRDHTGDPGGGTIPESKVIGRAFVIVWPISHLGGLGIPKEFHSISAAVVVGMPYGVGLAVVAPLAWVRLRRRRGGRRRRPA